MNRRRRQERTAAVNDRARGEEPTLRVVSYGSTFTWDAENGCRVNGEPYNPDPDTGVHQPLEAAR